LATEEGSKVKEEAEAWIRRAKRDMTISRYNFRGKMYDAAAFYAQQATEKALKALSIEVNGSFKRSHDLVELAAEVEAPSEVLRLCAIVSPAYTGTRYPDMPELGEREDVRNIVKASKEVVKWVMSRLM
jgi:HEPN domain-containing protein